MANRVDRTGPTAARRRLGAELRRLREALGISGEQAAAVLDGSQAKISRMESGITRPSVRDVRELLELYKTDGQTRDELLEIAAAASVRNRGWWKEYAAAFGIQVKQRVALEADASLILHFSPNMIPGGLQTAEYARAVFQNTGNQPTRENIDLAVAYRAARKEQVIQSSSRHHFLVTESTLRWRPADPEVQRIQLLTMANELSHLDMFTLRIIGDYPLDAILPAPDFTIYQFEDKAVPVVGYVEDSTGFHEVESSANIAYYDRVFRLMWERALSPGSSLEFIRKMAESITE